MSSDVRIRPAAYSVILNHGKILLAHYSVTLADGQNKKGWTLPGGGIEIREQPYEAARREAYEETGYTIEIDRLLDVHTAYFAEENNVIFCAHRTVYLSHIVSGELRCEKAGSTDRVEWVKLTDLHRYMPGTSEPKVPSIFDPVARMLGYDDAATWAREAQK